MFWLKCRAPHMPRRHAQHWRLCAFFLQHKFRSIVIAYIRALKCIEYLEYSPRQNKSFHLIKQMVFPIWYFHLTAAIGMIQFQSIAHHSHKHMSIVHCSASSLSHSTGISLSIAIPVACRMYRNALSQPAKKRLKINAAYQVEAIGEEQKENNWKSHNHTHTPLTHGLD